MTALSPPVRRARLTKSLSAHLSALVCSALVVAMVMGVVNGARVYFYCAAMERAALTDCCGHQDSDDSFARAPEPRVSAPCCEARRFGTVAAGVEAPRLPTLSAPLIAILPAVSTAQPAILKATREASSFAARAGPPTPSAQRAKLQVYLC
jgi:hypothetical protein